MFSLLFVFEALEFGKVVQVLLDVELGGGQILIGIIAAFNRRCAGNGAFELQNELAGIYNQTVYVATGKISEHNKVEPRATTHWTEIHHFVRLRAVPQKSCGKVFDCVHGSCAHRCSHIGLGNAHVKGGNAHALLLVPARNVQPAF